MKTGLTARLTNRSKPGKGKLPASLRLWRESRSKHRPEHFRVILAWESGTLIFTKRQALHLSNILIDLIETGSFEEYEAV